MNRNLNQPTKEADDYTAHAMEYTEILNLPNMILKYCQSLIGLAVK